MPNESLYERFLRFYKESCNFNKIPPDQQLHPSRLLCGYLKAASLLNVPGSFDVQTGHDKIYLPAPQKEMTDEDIVYLIRCGVRWDSEYECLTHFC